MNLPDLIRRTEIGAGPDGAREGELVRGESRLRGEAAEEAEGVGREAVGGKTCDGGIPDEEVRRVSRGGEEDGEGVGGAGAFGVEGDEGRGGDGGGVEAGGEEAGMELPGLGEMSAGGAELELGGVLVEVGVEVPTKAKTWAKGEDRLNDHV